MTDMGPENLPGELAELDAELSSIRYEERPSFAPELEADLAREWTALQSRRYRPVGTLAAAGLAGLLLIAVGVPSARAALVRFMGSLGVLVEEVPVPPPPAPDPEGPAILLGEGAAEPSLLGVPQPPTVPPPGPTRSDRYAVGESTLPELLDRMSAEVLIQRNYPIAFQRAGIGGVVGVLLWVDSTGTVGFVNLGKSSGVPDLDRAALQVAPLLRFEPARRQGRAVGTWVEFNVRFQPAQGRNDEDWILNASPAPSRGMAAATVNPK